MSKKQENKAGDIRLGIIYPNSAGIDVGSMNMVVSYQGPQGGSQVREYGSYTQELHALARELKSAGVRQVAMEATGVYWMAVYEVLEAYDLEVTLVNPSHYKNVAGQKTDISDSQGSISCTLMVSSGLPILPMRATGNSGRISMNVGSFKSRRAIRSIAYRKYLPK